MTNETINTSNNLKHVLSEFLLLLTEKERFVVERRFNLDGKERATLEEIGQHYTVTRERIRQIEKNALVKLKRHLENIPLFRVNNMAMDILSSNGGLMKEDLLLAELIKMDIEYKREILQLILSVDKRFLRIPNAVKFSAFIKLNEFPEDMIYNMGKNAENVLKKNAGTMSLEQIHKSIVLNKNVNLSLEALKSILKVNKAIKYLDNDKIGLMEWRHVNPKTLRDKIFYILRENKETMHFVDISNKIIAFGFDKKKVNLQAVHNELIRHDEFVLIGRGIYGLKEWGLVHGTVAEIIENLLKKNVSMSQDEIVKEVLKQRKVKPITILLSLKNKNQFVRVGRKQYALLQS